MITALLSIVVAIVCLVVLSFAMIYIKNRLVPPTLLYERISFMLSGIVAFMISFGGGLLLRDALKSSQLAQSIGPDFHALSGIPIIISLFTLWFIFYTLALLIVRRTSKEALSQPGEVSNSA